MIYPDETMIQCPWCGYEDSESKFLPLLDDRYECPNPKCYEVFRPREEIEKEIEQ